MLSRLSSLSLSLLLMLAPGPRQDVLVAEGGFAKEATVRFHAGDAAEFREPGFDDRNWSVAASGREGWGAPWPATATVGWYRWRWRVPPELWIDAERGELAVLFGSLGNADEVFVNGRRVGGEGRIARWCVLAPFKPRIYLVPAAFLRRDGENVIAVRVFRVLWADEAVTLPVEWGRWSDLHRRIDGRDRTQYFLEGILGGVYAAALLFWLSLWGRGSRERALLAFGPVLLTASAAMLFDSRLWFDLGWRTAAVEQVLAAIAAVFPVLALRFVAQLLRGCAPRGFRWLFVAPALAAAGLFALVSPLDGRSFCAVVAAWYVFTIAATALTLYYVAEAVWRRRAESWPMLAAIVAGAASFTVELWGGSYHRWSGIAAGYFGVAAALLCCMFALAAHHQSVRERLRLTSAAALAAHERERNRLARDLHDGVLQSLLALRLNLNMLQADEERPARHEQLALLLDESAAAIDELRRVAYDLRSADLERNGFSGAVRRCLERAAARMGIAAEARLDDAPAMTAKVADHLYRIAQEALQNVEKHSRATAVRLVFRAAAGEYILELHDNGCGFEASSPAGPGLGLATMRERAALLGGTAEIRSRSGAGTQVTIRVPRS